MSHSFSSIIGVSPVLQATIDVSRRLARTSSTVLLTGESGVGKELFASAIHSLREGANSPFVAVNCAAIMESLAESELFGYEKGAFSGADPRGKPGKIELARGGTLFLDEIGDMPLALQAKLLRILEDREYYPVGGTRSLSVDCRFIAATNKDLARLAEAGKFREDLYYRLDVISLDIPPLRRRADDIPLLAETFLRRFGIVEPMPAQLITALTDYSWPGNVRELRNAMERLSVFAEDGKPRAEHLPAAVLRATGADTKPTESLVECSPLPIDGTLPEWLADCERKYIEAALAETGDNKQAAAHRLGISRMTLYNKLSLLLGRSSSD
ncbi:sigma-54 interaction domain-containing protein [Cohnella endophytica]|nr:sigma 54-interacting transcriptional regulator [Cohnella endophytica]